MTEQGHYSVTLHRRRGWDTPERRTFPFGQWAEIGFWLDEVGAGEGDSLAVTFHPLVEPLPGGSITCPSCGAVFAWEGEEPVDCIRCGVRFRTDRIECAVDESAGQAEAWALHHWEEIMASGIEELELGVRAYNILKRQGVDTCGQLLDRGEIALVSWEYRNGTERSATWEQVREAQAGLRSILRNLEAEHLHSVRAELHEGAGLLDLHPVQGVDLDAVARLENFAREAGTPSTGQED